MIIACLVKEIQISTELRRMGDIGLVPQATVDDLIKQKFEAPLPRYLISKIICSINK